MTAATRGVILWDIDGTLVSVPPGRQDKHHAAALAVIGGPKEAPPSCQGRTDWEILSGLARAHGIEPTEEDRLRMVKALEALTETELEKLPAKVEVGIHAALTAAKEHGWANCLLTGNTRQRARLKLTSAGIEGAFDWGTSYFADFHATRAALVQEAVACLRVAHAGCVVLIVGDTPLDIQAASASGLPVVAVASGKYSLPMLVKHGPDLVLADMALGQESFLELLNALAPQPDTS